MDRPASHSQDACARIATVLDLEGVVDAGGPLGEQVDPVVLRRELPVAARHAVSGQKSDRRGVEVVGRIAVRAAGGAGVGGAMLDEGGADGGRNGGLLAALGLGGKLPVQLRGNDNSGRAWV
jgi:hypothetical protein